jgi:hypothetical protein
MTRDPADDGNNNNDSTPTPLESASYRQGSNRKVRSSPYKRNGSRNEGKPGYQQRNVQTSNTTNTNKNRSSYNKTSANTKTGVTGDGFKSARRFTGPLTGMGKFTIILYLSIIIYISKPFLLLKLFQKN